MARWQNIVVVSGLSGSGKSTAIRALEDAGYFCIDNLPVLLLPKVTELMSLGENTPKLALGIDAREGEFLKAAPRVLEEAKRDGYKVQVLFLDATDASLRRRFSETRRRHPLSPEGSVEQGIKLEREALGELRQMADQVIDTSTINVHELKQRVLAHFPSERKEGPSLSVMSFGYRYGVPVQADLMFDVRFLPNPYYIPELKPQTGLQAEVSKYVLSQPDAEPFLEKVVGLCEFAFPRYQKEGKAYLTVALGCTGGKHRSVAMAEALAKRLSKDGDAAAVWHRDVEKE